MPAGESGGRPSVWLDAWIGEYVSSLSCQGFQTEYVMLNLLNAKTIATYKRARIPYFLNESPKRKAETVQFRSTRRRQKKGKFEF